MKYFEKHPAIMVVVAVLGCGLASVFVKSSAAPSALTAAIRLLWTVLLLSPVTLGSKSFRHELISIDKIKGTEVLARPIMTNNYKELLSEGTRLKKDYIPKLRELGITNVYVK